LVFHLIVHQFAFHLMSINEQSLPPKPPTPTLPPSSSSSHPITKISTGTNTKPDELPKIQLQRFEKDTRKRRNPSAQISKRPISASKQPQPTLLPPLPPTLFPTSIVPSEPIKVLPLTI